MSRPQRESRQARDDRQMQCFNVLRQTVKEDAFLIEWVPQAHTVHNYVLADNDWLQNYVLYFHLSYSSRSSI